MTQYTLPSAMMADANGIEIAYETFGDPSAEPLLLVMGLGAQMFGWDDAFCEQLASHGYWVIRYDNRDIGRSTRFREAGIVNVMALMQGAPLEVPYKLHEMATDGIGLLDALGIEKAHVVGASMGGMISQMMAIHYPERLNTLTSIMSTTGNPALPPGSPEAMSVLFTAGPTDREGYIQHSLKSSRVLYGSGFAFDTERVIKRIALSYDVGLSPDGTNRQLAAIIASGSRKEALKAVQVPTLVIHGDDDPLVRVEGGIDTADAIPDAKLLIIPGMGHSIPIATWPQIISAIVTHMRG